MGPPDAWSVDLFSVARVEAGGFESQHPSCPCLPSNTNTADNHTLTFSPSSSPPSFSLLRPCRERSPLVPSDSQAPIPFALSSGPPLPPRPRSMSDQTLAQRSPRSRKSLSSGVSLGNQENLGLAPMLSAGKKGKSRAASIGGVELLGARGKPLLSPKKAARRAAVSSV